MTLKYLGTAGWEISDGRTTLLVDPYLPRLHMTSPNDDVLPGDTRQRFTQADAAESDTATIDKHIQRADFILVTHTHPDHALDVPDIARKTGATVIGTESARNLARAYGIPGDKLIVARGGDDLEFKGWSVRVIPSLHGILRQAPFLRRDPNSPPAPSVIPLDVTAPLHLNQFAEGGTLAELIRLDSKPSRFWIDQLSRARSGGVRGLTSRSSARCPSGARSTTTRAACSKRSEDPRTASRTHWDRFNVSYDVSQAPAIERLQSFLADVKAASPRSSRLFEAIEVR